MQRFRKAVRPLIMVTALLSLAALTACSHMPPVILAESKATRLLQGASAPYSGWLLTDNATATLLEQAEKCQTQR